MGEVEGEEAQPIFLSASLSVELSQTLLNLLREFERRFCLDLCQMPRLDPRLVSQNTISKEELDRTNRPLGMSD